MTSRTAQAARCGKERAVHGTGAAEIGKERAVHGTGAAEIRAGTLRAGTPGARTAGAAVAGAGRTARAGRWPTRCAGPAWRDLVSRRGRGSRAHPAGAPPGWMWLPIGIPPVDGFGPDRGQCVQCPAGIEGNALLAALAEPDVAEVLQHR